MTSTGASESRRFDSGKYLTPGALVCEVRQLTRDWRYGKNAWRRAVDEITAVLRRAFVADYLVLGGGHAKYVDPLPSAARRGGNDDAFAGGFRLWEEVVEPQDRTPPPVWRVVR
jgi:hypothetical protein